MPSLCTLGFIVSFGNQDMCAEGGGVEGNTEAHDNEAAAEPSNLGL